MKRYIRTAFSPIYIDIIVEFEHPYYNTVESAVKPKKKTASKPDDDLALDERRELIEDELTPLPDMFELTDDEQFAFNNFIACIDGMLNRFQFDVNEDGPGNQSSSSYYYKFFGADSDYEIKNSTLYIMRISTHIKKDSRNPTKYYRDIAEKYKTPSSKRKRGYEPVQILVNRDSYKTYKEACKAVESQFEEIQAECDKQNNK